MKQTIETLKAQLDAVQCTAEQRRAIQNTLKQLEKHQIKMDFQIQRNENDKQISINILEKTVEELNDRKYVLEEQSKIIEKKSSEVAYNYKKLEESYAELEQFMQIASHDLKSPLRTIGNYAQIIQRNCKEEQSELTKRYLEYIVNGVRHMSGIISDLMEYSKIDRHNISEIIDLREVITDVIHDIGSYGAMQDAEVIVPHMNIRFFGHRNNIYQLLFQLIENAIKYRDSHRLVIEIGAEEDKENILFYVKDNGLGLEDNFQDKAFLPFQRINYLDRPGLGMGLAICKKAVLMHEGKIWYKRNQEVGTTFFMSIPKTSKLKSMEYNPLPRNINL